MSERDNKTSGYPKGLPPETHNDEQDRRGEQAQDVADAARLAQSHTSGPTESTKPAGTGLDPAPSSKGDLVDEMRRMEGEGRIDMSAYAGEPNHDDEPGNYGGETTDDAAGDRFTADGKTLAEQVERLDNDSLLGDEEE